MIKIAEINHKIKYKQRDSLDYFGRIFIGLKILSWIVLIRDEAFCSQHSQSSMEKISNICDHAYVTIF